MKKQPTHKQILTTMIMETGLKVTPKTREDAIVIKLQD